MAAVVVESVGGAGGTGGEGRTDFAGSEGGQGAAGGAAGDVAITAPGGQGDDPHPCPPAACSPASSPRASPGGRGDATTLAADIATAGPQRRYALIDDLVFTLLEVPEVGDLVDLYDGFAPAGVFAPVDAASSPASASPRT